MRYFVSHRSTSVLAATFVLNIKRAFTMTSFANTFDYVVIGAGSGGIASAKRAASYGAKVAIIEGK